MEKGVISQDPLRSFLQDEFLKRKKKNPQFSLRALSRVLDLSPGRLSEYLSGRRRPSARTTMKLLERLGARPDSCLELMGILPASEHTQRNVAERAYFELREDQFKTLADWEHFAILSLLETRDRVSSAQVIGRRLGIGTVQARAAMDRLERLGLLLRSKEGSLKPSQVGIKTSEDISSSALRASHRQSLEQAITCLDDVSVEFRDISSITMAIDTRKLGAAKLLIRKFRRDLAALVECGVRDEVYNLNIQLVPVTKIASRRNSK